VPRGSLQFPISPSTDPRKDPGAHQTHLGFPGRKASHLSRTGAVVGTTASHSLHDPGTSPALAAIMQTMKFLTPDSFLRQTFVIYQAIYKYFSKI